MTTDEVKNKKVVVTNLDGEDVVLVAAPSGIKCFSSVCTHASCNVEYNASDQSLDCPCHGSNFDLDGNVVIGPAAAPLPVLKIKIQGDQIKLDQ